MRIDTDKYEGHTPAPWEPIRLNNRMWTVGKLIKFEWQEADANLIADAPLLLEEAKRLREENELFRQGIIDACYMASSGGIRPLADGTIKHYFPLYLRELIE